MSTPKVVYNDHERRTLVDLVIQHRTIIDSKRVDADSLTKKRQTWLKITNEYNRHPRVRKRLTKQLRRLWENTKARTKRGLTTAGPSSTAHELLNESIDDEADMETLNIEHNPNVDGVSDGDEVYVIANGGVVRTQKSRAVHPKKARHRLSHSAAEARSLESSAVDATAGDPGNEVSDILAPIVAARMRRNDAAINQQKELHQLAVQRERLQIKALEEQMTKQAEANAAKLERERELHELRIRHEQELHMQRMQNEQEIHQIRLAEYNKMHLAAYPNAIV